MNYATNIAIVENGRVVNVIWGYIYQLEEFAKNGLAAIPIGDLATQIGDVYENGRFYHNGTPVMTKEEEIQELDNYIIGLEYETTINDLEV